MTAPRQRDYRAIVKMSTGFFHLCGFLALSAWALGPGARAAMPTPCRIEAVDKDNGWPVPLVEFRTTHNLRLITDNAGVITVDSPELMDHEIWFDVIGHGYERKKDGFGYRGVRLRIEPGATLRVELDRTMIARRLGRITGTGLFAESRKSSDGGAPAESRVFGCDSVQTTLYRGRRFWAWGDTILGHYPLGIFHATGAFTEPNPWPDPKPPIASPFVPLTDERGRARAIATMPGTGLTWLTGLVSLPDADGIPRMSATYVKVKPPLDIYEIGLCVWSDDREQFDPLRVIWSRAEPKENPPPHPYGHAASWTDPKGRAWMLFGNPLPALRCPPTFEAWSDPSQWEPLTPQAELASAADGAKVLPHAGSIAWSAWRKRWIAIFTQKFGSPSMLGEIWYAEADSPPGPWGPAVKITTHENYTFYNPRAHAEMSPPDSPILLFEGTYTAEFSNHAARTPRHNYNQILYRLDLDAPALRPAQR